MSKVQLAVFAFPPKYSLPSSPRPQDGSVGAEWGYCNINTSSEAHVHWGSQTPNALLTLHLRPALPVRPRTETQREFRRRPTRSRLSTGESQQSLSRTAPRGSSVFLPPPFLTCVPSAHLGRSAPRSGPATPSQPRLPPSQSGSSPAPAGKGSGRARTA